MGNNVNRVFDSSGPEGKVRGTPQQIIDKYTQLARDATLSNDRVAAENFQQHAEHYTRMLSEAMREQEAKREAQEAQHQQHQQNRNRQRDSSGEHGNQPQAAPDPGSMPQPDTAGSNIVDVPEGGSSGLVETPEASGGSDAQQKPKRPRRQRQPKAEGANPESKPPEPKPPETPPQEAAE